MPVELFYSTFDWDNNILNMTTIIHMDNLVNGEWIPKDVSTEEFAKVRTDKANWRPRNASIDEAFSEFTDFGPRGVPAFLIDCETAISMGNYGPSWNAFINCLSEGSIFAIITARGNGADALRSGVEYIIDNSLNEDQKFTLYSNCLKHAYLFSSGEFSRIPKTQLSKTPLIRHYLDNCYFYPVSSPGFVKKFGEGSISNPEKAKEIALNEFIDICHEFGNKIGAKSVSVGFSDDDIKNVNHVEKYFKEKSALSNELSHTAKYHLYDTSKGGMKKQKFEITEGFGPGGTVQTPGLASSIMPFTSFNNITNRLSPSNQDGSDNDPVKHTHNMAVDYLSKKFRVKKRKKNMKHISSFENFSIVEKWEGSPKIKHTGEWAKFTISELIRKRDALKSKKSRTPKESKKLRQINFAIRSKKRGSGKWGKVK